jgi:hypothetical protein
MHACPLRARCFGYLGQGGYLFLGAFGTFTFAFAIFWPGANANGMSFAGMIGFFSIPFGLLGGWLLWVTAVRPATSRKETADASLE